MESPADIAALRKVHLIAIAGVGMAGLAGMFKQRGLVVSGSDEHVYPPMSDVLERLGITVSEGFRPENIGDPDVVVIGNKVSRGNAEVQGVLDRGLAYVSFPEALARYFIAGHRSLVVAGTHGKTTSTAMLAWVLEQAGRDPSVMLGGESLDFGGNFKLGGGEHFAVEGDEYDSAFFDKGPKFLHYRPNAVILTAVEFDHADIYADLPAVKESFRRLVALLPAGAPLVVAGEFPHAVEVAETGAAEVITFGERSEAAWQLADLYDDGNRTRFAVRYQQRAEGTVALRQPGVINARNALGVYALSRHIGLSHGEIAAGLASFSGVRRRQELVGEYGGITLIDDFAHHPTAVAGTLAALRGRYPRRRLWALFEPRSNTSRRKIFQAEYVAAFSTADQVIVASVFRKETDPIDEESLFSADQLVGDLRTKGVPASTFDSTDAIADDIVANAVAGDVVIMMSNGAFGGLRAKLVGRLSGR